MHLKEDGNKIREPASCDFCGADRKLCGAFIISYRNVGICVGCVGDCTVMMLAKLSAPAATEKNDGKVPDHS